MLAVIQLLRANCYCEPTYYCEPIIFLRRREVGELYPNANLLENVVQKSATICAEKEIEINQKENADEIF